MSKKLVAHILLFFVAVIYGANYLVAKGLMPDLIGPSGFIFIRVSAATVLFWIVYLLSYEKIDKKDLVRLALCGLTGVATNQLFFFNGLNATSPVNASIIMTSNPILVLVVSAIILKTRITSRKLAGIFLGAAGAIVLLLLQGSAKISWQGDVMILINALSYGIYLVLVKPLMVKYKPVTVITWVFTMGLILVAPIGFNQFMAIDWSSFTSSHWLGVFYVVICTTFLVYLMNIYALKTVQPTVVSVYIYLQPLLAGIFAYIFASFGGEDYTGDINWQRILCALAIFVGVYLVSVPARRQR
ncbi:DMT family transporter [Sanyastnella coralliicola]|uniref:DMT family transporter n=1 Tax=Sanyastnella coralliicola TaxID=3069118 RepID=UPI0027BB12FF|nr:DMT family transporter [Longitalea sp. SCSIO 12813]